MQKIDIIFENSDFFAIEKPYGISVHNTEQAENLITLLTKQINIQPLPIHRLDKETSGIQLFAKSEIAARTLSKQFEEKSVEKFYQAVLRGSLNNLKGVWRQSLSDKAEGRKNPQGLSKDRVECITEFEVLEKNQHLTFCQFKLITGRQHQIRKHAAINKHPIVGDPRYNDPKYNQKMFQIYKTDRMFLHCNQITIAGIIIKSDSHFEKLFRG